RRIGLAAALWLCPAIAAAGNGISQIALRQEPNLTSVAVQAIVSGDDDTTAVLRIFQKWRENPAFDTGMVMVRRRGTHLYEGRILWMGAGRFVQYYVEGRDAAGDLSTTVQTASVNTLRQLVATGPVFYVDQRTGSDAFDGKRPRYSLGL